MAELGGLAQREAGVAGLWELGEGGTALGPKEAVEAAGLAPGLEEEGWGRVAELEDLEETAGAGAVVREGVAICIPSLPTLHTKCTPQTAANHIDMDSKNHQGLTGKTLHTFHTAVQRSSCCQSCSQSVGKLHLDIPLSHS